MAKKTENLGLVKPDPTDMMNVEVLNDNFDKIDEAFRAGTGGGASVEDVLAAIPTVTGVAVTENADGSVTMVNSLSDGSTETIFITADAEGNPWGLSVNGIPIPLTWTEDSV